MEGEPSSARTIGRRSSSCSTALWGLDSLFHCHVKLLARDVHQLRSVQDAVQVALLPPAMRPVRFLQVVGRVVSVTRNRQRTVLYIDDTTGIVPAIVKSSHEEKVLGSGAGVSLACLVVAYGRVDWFRARIQLRVDQLEFPDDPNVELLWWEETVRLRAELYSASVDLVGQLEDRPRRSEEAHGEWEGTAPRRRRRHDGQAPVAPLREVAMVAEEAAAATASGNGIDDEIRTAVLQFLRRETERHGGATWQEILDAPELRRRFCDTAGGPGASSVKLQAALLQLRRRGQIFCRSSSPAARSTSTEQFAAVREAHLSNAVVQIVGVESRSVRDSQDDRQNFAGTTQHRILAALEAEHFPGASIPAASLKGVLDHLMRSGDLYEVQEGTYRLVDR